MFSRLHILFAPAILALFMFVFYGYLAWLSSGPDWWHIDFVAGGNVYWGDDAYRYFLARTAWINPDMYWFNFVLPGAVFLDGLITTLSDGQLVYARILKCVPLVASLFLVYFTCTRLDVRRTWALLAAWVLAFTPLYFFVSLSFYGESWITFFASLALFLLAHRKLMLAAFVIGLMPLFRIESLGFVAGFALLSLYLKDRKSLLAVFAPGGTYFLLIVLIGPGVSSFLGWRFEIMDVYDGVGIWYGGEPSRIFEVLYWPWLLVAAIGLCQKEARPILPALVGAILIIAQLVSSVVMETGNFEPRFLVGTFPVMAVGLGLGLQGQEAIWRKYKLGRAFIGAAAMLIALIMYSHVLSVHAFKELRQYVAVNGSLPSSVLDAPFKMETYFKKTGAEKIAGYKEYADVAMQMIEKNPSIKTLVVSSSNVIYYLDPKRIPNSVDVVFALFGWRTLSPVLDGPVTFGYYAHPPFSSYYSLSIPQKGDSLLLYLDDIELKEYPYHWIVKESDIYLFAATKMQASGITALPKADK